MFSHRLPWDLKTNTLSDLLEQTRLSGGRLLDLTESNPTRAGLSYPAPELLKSLGSPRALRYEPEPLGMESAREAVASYYAEMGVNVSPGRIVLTASTSEAYAYLFKLLADAGEEVLIPRPSYPLFDFLAGLESVRVRQYPLQYDGSWHIDFHAIEDAVQPGTRAIVVVNPNNPTGHYLKNSDVARLEALALRHDLAIISDEVFADYPLSQDSQRVGMLANDRAALSFSLGGLSKVAGLPQMKLGWIVGSGPQADHAIGRLELIADTYLSVGTPVQLALPRLLEIGVEVRAQILERVRANLRLLLDTLAGSAANLLNVEGGWYAVIQVPRTRTEEEWATMLLARQGVLVQPGYFFDFTSEAFLVVSLLTSPDVFREGVERSRGVL